MTTKHRAPSIVDTLGLRGYPSVLDDPPRPLTAREIELLNRFFRGVLEVPPCP